MSTFYWACAGLVLLSSVFFLFPRRRDAGGEQEVARANIDWLKLREAELAGEDEALREEARLRLLEDGALTDDVEPGRTETVSPFPGWALLPVIALFSAALYYFLGAAPDVVISRQLENLGSSSSEQDMQRLASAMQSRVEQRPENLQYLALLGRYYMGQQQYALASQSFNSLAQAAPEDSEALAYAAQAEYLAAGRVLSGTARLRAEQALAANPHQRTALGLLGMASYEAQQYRAAINYWERLLAVEVPGSQSAAMISDVINTARQQLGEVAGDGVGEDVGDGVDEKAGESAGKAAGNGEGASVPAQAAASMGVTVSVDLPPDATRNASDTVFILARNAASGSRMPIAVQRLTVSQLPVSLRLDDSNSMAGQTFSEDLSVVVAVQVSPSGRPGLDNASWAGEVGPLTPSVSTDPVTVTLQSAAP